VPRVSERALADSSVGGKSSEYSGLRLSRVIRDRKFESGSLQGRVVRTPMETVDARGPWPRPLFIGGTRWRRPRRAVSSRPRQPVCNDARARSVAVPLGRSAVQFQRPGRFRGSDRRQRDRHREYLVKRARTPRGGTILCLRKLSGRSCSTRFAGADSHCRGTASGPRGAIAYALTRFCHARDGMARSAVSFSAVTITHGGERS
jgi:hypothetical protein